MSQNNPQLLVEEATFDYTMGDNDSALEKITLALERDPKCFEAYHTRTEVLFSERKFNAALEAALQAHELRPKDIHINTSLSRIYMEKGDKKTAEYYGAQARMLSWKTKLKQ